MLFFIGFFFEFLGLGYLYESYYEVESICNFNNQFFEGGFYLMQFKFICYDFWIIGMD